MLEVELIKILVHNGFDQCRTALDRLANRSFYKQFKHSIKQGDTISFIPYVGLDDSRWFQLDEVSRSVDDAIVRLRNIPFDSFSDDSLSIGSANSQWADPDSQSPRRSNGLDREDTCDLDKFISPHYDIDNHPYANRKRKYYKTSVVSRKRSHGINFKETRDSDRRPRKTTSNRRICRRDGQTANEKVQEMDDNNLGLVTSDADCSSRETGTPTRKQGYPESTDATRAHKSIAHRCVASRLQRGPMVTKRNVITESVPDLDNILLTRVDSKIRSQRGAGRHNDSKSASDKMTKWLHANAGNDINNHKRNGKKRVMQKQNDKYRAQRMESRDKLCKGPERLDAKITRSSLFSVLRRPNALPKDKRQPNSKGGTVADLCQSLRKTKCAKDCALLIDDIYNVMSSPTHQEVALLFQTMFDLLKAGGCRTLQDLISDSSPALEMHVAVLVGLLRLLRDEVNHALTPSNGLTYQIFGLGHFSAFFDFVVLQLVDSVMSLLLPDAWDLRINGLRAVLAILEPLRDELAGCLPLVDRGCRCLEKQLEQQEWRCVRQGANVFVSSVDPNTWLKYLESATTPQKRQIVRLSSFGQCLPRCEIEAIWSLVAFFASSRNCSDVACDHWKFFTNLLSKGSLCRVAIDLSLPPQSEQLLAAVSDVTNLTDLIASGRMGCLPRRDEALFDILKRAVSLQIDDLLLNDASHSRLYPTVDQDDGSFSLINLSRYTNGVNDTGALKSLSDAASLGNSDVYFMGHPLLLPSSMVLRCCLRLMVVWKNNLPRSVTRQRLFNNAMSSFLKSITATDAVESLAEVQADEDRFSEAFSISSGRPVEGNLDSRRNDFQHECSAYMAMFASGFVMVDQEACASMLCPEKVWALLSNDAMKTFRTRSSERKDIHHAANYHGSNVLIYVCAKVITLSALSWMGASAVEVHPQHPVATTAHGNSFDDASSKECGFAMSCLVTCLECARGSTQNMTIVISVLNYIGIIISAANKKFASLRHRKLIVQSFLNSVSLLKKCFLAVIQAPEHGNEGDFFLQIFFSVSDGIIEMSPSNGLRHDQFSSCRSPEYQDATDECFNDFDDDILASMDLTLGHNDSTASNSIFCFLSSLYDCIAEALVAAKPSARNVSPNINSVDRNHLSTQGMKLVHDRLEVMCLLLADIAAIIWYPTCNIKWLWVVQRRIPTTHDEDTQYFLILAQMITRDICNQRHIPNVVTLVDQFKESTLFTFLEFALESKILVGVPSCNLDRIASSSGQNGRKKGGSDLSNFAKGLPKSLVDGVAAVRKFGGNLGQIFVDIHNKEGNISLFSLGRLMICFEEGYDKNPSLLVPSVESECISRFTLLQGLFRSFSFCGNNWTSFERLSSLLLATCSAELVRLLLKIGIQDIAHQEMLHSVYDRARLFETVTCYSELYVNLMAEVFRTASKYSLSGQFQQLLLYAADSFIFPLISEQSDIPLISYLKEIAYLSIAVLTNSTNSKRGNVDIFSSYDHKPYCNVFREALLRRRKEFTYFVAKYYKSVPSASLSNILSVLFTVGGRNEEMHKVSLRQYFSVTSLATSVTVDTSFTSPLSAGIEECYSHAEDSLSKISMPSVVALKYYSLQQFLIPRLLDRGLSPSTLSEVLLTIQVLLELENERRDGDVTLDLFVLCSLCRGIGTCVCLSLFADDPSLHEDIVAASFSCAMALFNAPATAVDCSASGNVLDWLKASFETIDHGGLEQMHPGNYHAHYIWCFYSWLSDFGNAVKDFSQSSQCRKLLIQLREKRCFELPKRYDWAYFGTTPDRALMFECITELDDILFPVARAANGAPITNVYKSNHSNGPPLISKPGLKSNAFTRGDCLEWNLNSKTDAAICSFLSMQGGG